MRFYKQCTVEGNRLYSVNRHCGCDIEYFRDRIMYAPSKTGLFVFNNLQAALDYDSHISNRVVFECEVADPRKIVDIVCAFDSRHYWEVRSAWDGNVSWIEFSRQRGVEFSWSSQDVHTVSKLRLTHEIKRW